MMMNNNPPQEMLIVHTEKHKLHNPKLYFALGRMNSYPEQPSRVESILRALKIRAKSCKPHSLAHRTIPPSDYGLAPILAVHSQKYLNYVETAYDRWILKGGDVNGVIPDTYAVHLNSIYRDITLQTRSENVFAQMGLYTFDSATVIVKDTYIAAYEAAQCALTAADCLIKDGLESAYALCRPPGHHSSDELLGGFCFMNNAAIASQYLIDTYNLKVCILDIDYHHGNGTQCIFYGKSNPMFISLHDSEADPFYWGSANEKGAGEGQGYNINIPLPSGTGDAAYLVALEDAIKKHIIPYAPDVLVVSLGVDTFVDDPVGTFAITSDCFTKIGAVIRQAKVPTLFVQEGGYDSPELGVNVCNVLEGFTNAKPSSAEDLLRSESTVTLA